VVINVEYKKKKVIITKLSLKLSLITNKNGFIHSIMPFDIKNKNINYSTSVHDVKMTEKNVNDIFNINNDSKYYNLLADKAYKTKDEYKLNNKKITIISG